MTSQTFVLLSGTLTFGVPMALALWDLLTIPGPDRRDDDPGRRKPVGPVPGPLPECLRPVRFPPGGPVEARVTAPGATDSTTKHLVTQAR